MLVAVTLFTITQASDYADLESPEKISKQERAVWINNFFNPVSDYVQEGYKAFQDSYTQGVERQDSSESQGSITKAKAGGAVTPAAQPAVQPAAPTATPQ